MNVLVFVVVVAVACGLAYWKVPKFKALVNKLMGRAAE